MSAFVVCDQQVSAILQVVYGKTHGGANIWAYQNDPKAYHFVAGALASWQAEANELMRENVRSVNWRYRNSPDIEQEKFVGNVKLDLNAEPVSVMQALKWIDCLAYQSCETDDWEKTEAYKLLNRYRGMLVCKLPGYNDAKWSI
jgi:hypothetical protein